jgi:hypothetical protein
MHLIRNPIILAIPKREVHVLQTLGRRTLEEIIDRRIDDNTLAGGVHGKATNLDAVFAANVFHERRLADDFDEFFAGVAVLVDVADVTGCHCAVEGNGDCVLWESLVQFKQGIWVRLVCGTYVDTLEPDRDVRNESDFSAQLPRNFLLMHVVN